MSTRPRGRRAGGDPADTRSHILTCALEEFTASGYDATSMRAVARRAGVDPSLLRYYFPGGKAEMFVAALADLGVDPVQVSGKVLAEGTENLGERLLLRVIDVWDGAGGRDQFRLVVAALASGQSALFRDFLVREVGVRLEAVTTGPDALLRVELFMSQIAGVLVARYVMEFEPLASEPAESIARRLGPALDAVLRGDGPPVPLASGAEDGQNSPHEE